MNRPRITLIAVALGALGFLALPFQLTASENGHPLPPAACEHPLGQVLTKIARDHDDFPIEKIYANVSIQVGRSGELLFSRASKAFILWRQSTPPWIEDVRFAFHYIEKDHLLGWAMHQIRSEQEAPSTHEVVSEHPEAQPPARLFNDLKEALGRTEAGRAQLRRARFEPLADAYDHFASNSVLDYPYVMKFLVIERKNGAALEHEIVTFVVDANEPYNMIHDIVGNWFESSLPAAVVTSGGFVEKMTLVRDNTGKYGIKSIRLSAHAWTDRKSKTQRSLQDEFSEVKKLVSSSGLPLLPDCEIVVD